MPPSIKSFICFVIAFAIGFTGSSLRDFAFAIAGTILGSMVTYNILKN